MTAAEATGTLASALLRASWQGGAAVAMAWLLCKALPGLPAAWRCWVWRAAVARLLLSLAVAGTVALPLLPVEADPTGTWDASSAFGEVGGETVTHGAATAAARTATTTPRLQGGGRSVLLELCVSIWAVGVLVFAANVVRARFGVKALRGGAAEVSNESLRQACHQLCRRLGVASVPRLLHSSAVDAPALIGCLSPSVLLPSAAPRRRTEHPGDGAAETLRMMLAHELAHVKRHDLWWNWLPLAAQTLLWFHPLAWLASRELRPAQESACDELAIAATGEPPRRYGAMLLDVIETVRVHRRPPRAFSAAVVDTRRSVERRLTAMNHFSHPRPRTLRVATSIALAAAGAVAMVPWRLVAQTPAPTIETRAELAPRDRSPAGAPADANNASGAPHRPTTAEALRLAGVVTAPELALGVAAGGLIADVPVNVGDAVKRGQLLARLDDSVAAAALVEAEATYKLKQVQLKRLAELRANNGTTEAEVEAGEAEAQVAQARIAAAKHALMATRVVAPADGVVAEIAARPGEVAQAGAVLVKLIDRGKLSLTFHLPDQELSRVRIGNSVTVAVSSVPDARFDATIASISPVVQTASGTVVVRARFDDASGRIRPGMAGQVIIPTDDQRAVR